MKFLIPFLALNFGMVTLASAADINSSVGQQVTFDAAPATYDWSGAYVGANADISYNESLKSTNVSPGLQAGFNMQSGQIVYGGEVSASANNGEYKIGNKKLEQKATGQLKMRAGYAFDRTLVYGTAGATFACFKSDKCRNKVGYVVGAGVEYAVSDAVRLNAEWNQEKYDNVESRFDNVLRKWDVTSRSLKVGVKVAF